VYRQWVEGIEKLEVDKWYVVSIFDGVGGAFVALDTLGIKFEGVAVESRAHLRDFVKAKYPHISHVHQVGCLKTDGIISEAQRLECAGILFIRGPPCQFIHQKISDFVDLRNAVRVECINLGIHIRWLMEEVATLEPDSEFTGAVPVLIHAADWGWVHRARLYWGPNFDNVESEADRCELFRAGEKFPDVHMIRWKGMPIPAQWIPSNGIWKHQNEGGLSGPRMLGEEWKPVYENGRLLAFTAAFPHAKVRGVGTGDKPMEERFDDDHRRFPMSQYAAHNLIEEAQRAIGHCNSRRQRGSTWLSARLRCTPSPTASRQSRTNHSRGYQVLGR